MDLLRHWVEEKYNLPWTHEAIQSQSLFELTTSFWEDYYRKNPTTTRRSPDGKVVFENTGDPLIDKWEKELAQGLAPDLLEGMSPEQRRAEEEALERLKKSKKPPGDPEIAEGFDENYG